MLVYSHIVLLFLVLGTAHLLRVRCLNRRLRQSLELRLEDRIQERTRIARDLHDSFFQRFQGLMFRLEAVRLLLPARPEEAATQLDIAIQRGLAAIDEGRRTITELRAAAPMSSDLSQALAELGPELETLGPVDAAPEYRVLVKGRPIELVPIVRDETYRIVREAVRNAFRHARANFIEVESVFGEKTFTVRVRDDGIGLDPGVLARGYRNGHWGLPGMRERALRFGGDLQLWSQLDAGTEIELNIAGATAYSQRVEQ